MRTKISAFCNHVIEAGWLLALIIVPLFFNVYSSRVFEPDKLGLVRSIAVLMALAWLAKTCEEGLSGRAAQEGSLTQSWERFLHTPLVLPTLLLVVLYLLATATSVVPRISLWGSYQRLQGMYSTLSYVVIFLLLLLNLRRREQLQRLTTTIILTSLPISLYGLLQRYQLDPLPWAGDVSIRIAANMGNAIFIGAYLIMVVPVTLARTIQLQLVTSEGASLKVRMALDAGYWGLMLIQLWSWIALGFERGLLAGGLILVMLSLAAAYFGQSVTRTVLRGCYGLILNAQLASILFSQSRGPWLGLLGFAFFFVLIMLVSLARRAQSENPQTLADVGRGVGLGLATLGLGGALAWVFIQELHSALLGLMLAAGVVIVPYILLLVTRTGLRWLWLTWITQTVLVAGFLVIFNLPSIPLGTLRDAPYIGRLGRVFETEGGTGKVRVLIWEGAVEMLKSDPARTLIGYGPEAMYMAYNPFYPPDLAHYEARNASPDRSHNETFDALIMTGVVGCILYMLLFGSIFYYGLSWSGLIRGRTQQYLFVIPAVVGSLLGILVPYALDGTLRFMGVGIPSGFMAGLFLYVIISSLMAMSGRSPSASDAPQLSGARLLLLVALTGAVVGHFIEINFGIAIASTRTYFWAYAALIVVLGQGLIPEQAEATASVSEERAPTLAARGAPTRRSGTRRKGGRGRSATPAQSAPSASPVGPGSFTARLAPLAVCVALILMTMAWDYTTNTLGETNPFKVLATSLATMTSKGQPNRITLGMLWMALATLLIALVTTIAEANEGDKDLDLNRWLSGAGTFVLIAGSLGGLYALIHAARLNPAFGIANLIYEYYSVALVIWVLLAFTLYLTHARPAVATRGWRALGYAILVVIGILFIENANIRIVKADVYYKQGLKFDQEKVWDNAIYFYQKAIDLTPNEDFYHLFRGRVVMEKAKVERDVKRRDALFNDALASLEKAKRLNPLNTDHSANMGRLHRTWAELDSDPNGRHTKLQKALTFYQEATQLSPHNAALYNEWGLVHYLLGDGDQAMAKYQESLALDREFPQTYLLLGDLYLARKQWPEAAQTYERIAEADETAIQAWSALGYAYSQMGELEKAIAANLKVLRFAPSDYSTIKNLAILNNELQRPAEALLYAERALAMAPEQDKATLEAFVQQLRAQVGKDKP